MYKLSQLCKAVLVFNCQSAYHRQMPKFPTGLKKFSCCLTPRSCAGKRCKWSLLPTECKRHCLHTHYFSSPETFLLFPQACRCCYAACCLRGVWHREPLGWRNAKASLITEAAGRDSSTPSPESRGPAVNGTVIYLSGHTPVWSPLSHWTGTQGVVLTHRIAESQKVIPSSISCQGQWGAVDRLRSRRGPRVTQFREGPKLKAKHPANDRTKVWSCK